MPARYYETLISTDHLSTNLDRPDWVVVDCRFDLADAGRGERDYLAGHVPGACYAHLDRDLSGPVGPSTGRHPLPDADRLMAWLGAQGIGNDTQVVAYDDSGGAMAVRLWWLLRWLGHRRVAVVDGGWQAWLAGGHPVSVALPAPTPAVFEGAPDASIVVTTEQLVAGNARARVVDVRTPERFRGEKEPIDPVAGRIPGAVNLPLQLNLDSEGRFRSAEALKALYDPVVGDADPGELIFMCGSGVTACHGILALELAGYPGALLYAGSWSEWIRDPARPVAVGEP